MLELVRSIREENFDPLAAFRQPRVALVLTASGAGVVHTTVHTSAIHTTVLTSAVDAPTMQTDSVHASNVHTPTVHTPTVHTPTVHSPSAHNSASGLTSGGGLTGVDGISDGIAAEIGVGEGGTPDAAAIHTDVHTSAAEVVHTDLHTDLHTGRVTDVVHTGIHTSLVRAALEVVTFDAAAEVVAWFGAVGKRLEVNMYPYIDIDCSLNKYKCHV